MTIPVTTIDDAAIQALGNRFIQLANDLYNLGQTTSSLLQSVDWSGDGHTAAVNAWTHIVSTAITPTADGLAQVGQSIQEFANQVREARAEAQKQQLIQIFSGVAMIVLLPLDFAIAPLLSMAASLVGRIVANLGRIVTVSGTRSISAGLEAITLGVVEGVTPTLNPVRQVVEKVVTGAADVVFNSSTAFLESVGAQAAAHKLAGADWNPGMIDPGMEAAFAFGAGFMGAGMRYIDPVPHAGVRPGGEVPVAPVPVPVVKEQGFVIPPGHPAFGSPKAADFELGSPGSIVVSPKIDPVDATVQPLTPTGPRGGGEGGLSEGVTLPPAQFHADPARVTTPGPGVLGGSGGPVPAPEPRSVPGGPTSATKSGSGIVPAVQPPGKEPSGTVPPRESGSPGRPAGTAPEAKLATHDPTPQVATSSRVPGKEAAPTSHSDLHDAGLTTHGANREPGNPRALPDPGKPVPRTGESGSTPRAEPPHRATHESSVPPEEGALKNSTAKDGATIPGPEGATTRSAGTSETDVTTKSTVAHDVGTTSSAPQVGPDGVAAHGVTAKSSPSIVDGEPHVGNGQVGLRPPDVPESVRGAGTEWFWQPDGWHVAHEPGSLRLGPGADGELVVLPPGSRAAHDGEGGLSLVVSRDGPTYYRSFAGDWSTASPGQIALRPIRDPQHLTLADGGSTITIPKGDMVVDTVTGRTIAYRAAPYRDLDGALIEHRTFVPDGEGRWVGRDTQPEKVEALLAAANGEPEVARAMLDIARRSAPGTSGGKPLGGLTHAELHGLLRGSRNDASAAMYEVIRRASGLRLRWTQLMASDNFLAQRPVQLSAGEGKSLAYLHYVGRSVFRDVDAMQVVTTRGHLADREFKVYESVFEPFRGEVTVVRMTSRGVHPPVTGKTIYVGTVGDVAFSLLRGKRIGGRVFVLDEFDEFLIYNRGQFILSKGVTGAAPARVQRAVMWAHEFLHAHLGDGSLTEVDFGRRPGQVGDQGPAALTGEGRRRVESLLGRPLPPKRARLLNLAASAHWDYREHTDYIVDRNRGAGRGRIVIIDPFTHAPMVDLSTTVERTSESRWQGLAQFLEAKHGLPIRADTTSSSSITPARLVADPQYSAVVGASGTNGGTLKAEVYRRLGLGEVVTVPRYYESQLVSLPDRVFPDRATKLAAIVEDVKAMRVDQPERPILVLADDNELVFRISKVLDHEGVGHTAFDATTYLKHGSAAQLEFEKLLDEAGRPGRVTVTNMYPARGADISATDLHVIVTARSPHSADIDLQAASRTARSGRSGTVQFYVATTDPLFVRSPNPEVRLVTVHYTDTVASPGSLTGDIARAATAVRELVPNLQVQAARRFLVDVLAAHLAEAAPLRPATSVPPGQAATPQPSPPPAVNGPPEAQQWQDLVATLARLVDPRSPGSALTWSDFQEQVTDRISAELNTMAATHHTLSGEALDRLLAATAKDITPRIQQEALAAVVLDAVGDAQPVDPGRPEPVSAHPDGRTWQQALTIVERVGSAPGLSPDTVWLQVLHQPATVDAAVNRLTPLRSMKGKGADLPIGYEAEVLATRTDLLAHGYTGLLPDDPLADPSDPDSRTLLAAMELRHRGQHPPTPGSSAPLAASVLGPLVRSVVRAQLRDALARYTFQPGTDVASWLLAEESARSTLVGEQLAAALAVDGTQAPPPSAAVVAQALSRDPGSIEASLRAGQSEDAFLRLYTRASGFKQTWYHTRLMMGHDAATRAALARAREDTLRVAYGLRHAGPDAAVAVARALAASAGGPSTPGGVPPGGNPNATAADGTAQDSTGGTAQTGTAQPDGPEVDLSQPGPAGRKVSWLNSRRPPRSATVGSARSTSSGAGSILMTRRSIRSTASTRSDAGSESRQDTAARWAASTTDHLSYRVLWTRALLFAAGTTFVLKLPGADPYGLNRRVLALQTRAAADAGRLWVVIGGDTTDVSEAVDHLLGLHDDPSTEPRYHLVAGEAQEVVARAIAAALTARGATADVEVLAEPGGSTSTRPVTSGSPAGPSTTVSSVSTTSTGATLITRAEADWARLMEELILERQDLARRYLHGNPDGARLLADLDRAIGDLRTAIRAADALRSKDPSGATASAKTNPATTTGSSAGDLGDLEPALSRRTTATSHSGVGSVQEYRAEQVALVQAMVKSPARRAWFRLFFETNAEFAYLLGIRVPTPNDMVLLARDVLGATRADGRPRLEVTEEDERLLDTYAKQLLDDHEPVTLALLRRQAAYAALEDRLTAQIGRPPGLMAGRLSLAAVTRLGLTGQARARRVLELRGLLELDAELPFPVELNRTNVWILARAAHLAHRLHRRDNYRQDLLVPLTVADLRATVRQRLGPAAPFTLGTLELAAKAVPAADHGWRRYWREYSKSVRRTAIVRWTHGVRRAGVGSAVGWRIRHRYKFSVRLDNHADRAAERREVERTLGVDTTTVLERDALVRLRRQAFARRRYRVYQDLTDYAPMALLFLGKGGTLAKDDLTRLAKVAAAIYREYDTPMGHVRGLRAVITTHALSRWSTEVQPAREQATGWVDHSELVTAYNTITAIRGAGRVAAWLNGLIPGGGTITRTDIEQSLSANIGTALDEGAEFTVTRDGRTYDVRLWPVVTGEPQVLDIPERPGSSESRKFAFLSKTATRQSQRGGTYEGKAAYILGRKGVASGEFGGTVSRTFYGGDKSVMGFASAVYQWIRAKGKLGAVTAPIAWEVMITSREDQRWISATLHDPAQPSGVALADSIEYLVPEFMVPHPVTKLPAEYQELYDDNYRNGPREIENPDTFKLWDEPFAVTRLKLAEKVMAELRAKLSREEYAFWKEQVEVELANDQLAMRLADLLRPGATFTDVFRVMLQRDGRSLSLSLAQPSGAAVTPIKRWKVISRISYQNTRFDRISSSYTISMHGKDRTTGGRGTGSAAASFFHYASAAVKLAYARRLVISQLHGGRAWLTWARRLAGPEQIVKIDFTVDLNAVVVDAQGNEVTIDGVELAGYAHVLTEYTALPADPAVPRPVVPAGTEVPKDPTTALQARAFQAEYEREKNARMTERDDITWWNPHGPSVDYFESFDGFGALYDSIVPDMVGRGYLPAAALGPAGTASPWAHLDTLHTTAKELNRAGAAYQNWRDLVRALTNDSMRAHTADLPGGGSGKPGVILTFDHPTDPHGQLYTVGLWATFGTATHKGTTGHYIQFGHTHVDTMTTRRQRGHLVDFSAQGGLSAFFGRLLPGWQWNRWWSSRSGNTQSNATFSDTDGQNMPSARYEVDLTWHWIGLVGDDEVVATKDVDGRAVVLQPEELADKVPGPAPVPTAPLSPDGPSPLTRMNNVAYTVLGVDGLGDLQDALLAAPSAPSKVDVWHGLSPSAYRALVLRALLFGAPVLIGSQELNLKIEAVGPLDLERTWLAYTQQGQEAQVGKDAMRDLTVLKGFLGSLGLGIGRPPTDSDATKSDPTAAPTTDAEPGTEAAGGIDAGYARLVGKMKDNDLTLFTEGSYRALFQDAYMGIVATDVINTITLPDGTTVKARGRLWLNMLLRDVLTHRDAVRDPHNLLAARMAEMVRDGKPVPETIPEFQPFAGLDSDHVAPSSVDNGHAWLPVWTLTYPGEEHTPRAPHLRQALHDMGLEFGDQDLANQAAALSTWVGTSLSDMIQGGASWVIKTSAGNIYQVLIEAELLGPARNARPSSDAKSGVKVYTRTNDTKQVAGGETTLETKSISPHASGSSATVADAEASATVTETTRKDRSQEKAGNTMRMDGIRANPTTDFDKAIRFTVGITRLAALGQPSVSLSPRTVTQDYTGTVPRAAMRPKAKAAPSYQFGLKPRLPSGQSRVIGSSGLVDILNVVKEAGKRPRKLYAEPPETPAVVRDRLTTRSLRTSFGAMLRPQGAAFGSVADGSEVVEATTTVTARFGPVGQIFHLSDSELEQYAHLTKLASQTAVDTRRTTFSGSASGTIDFGGHGLDLGGRLAREEIETAARVDAMWNETRSWLRDDLAVFVIYATVLYDVSVYDSAGVPKLDTVVGAVELVVTEAGAIEMGVPAAVLDQVKSERYNEELADSPPASGPERTIVERFREVTEAFQAIRPAGSTSTPPVTSGSTSTSTSTSTPAPAPSTATGVRSGSTAPGKPAGSAPPFDPLAAMSRFFWRAWAPAGFRAVDVPQTEDSVFHALFAMAGDPLDSLLATGTAPSTISADRAALRVRRLRGWVADRLAADFAVTDAGLPGRYEAMFPYEPGVDRVAQQAAWVEEVRQPGTWNVHIGHTILTVAANELGLSVVLHERDRPQRHVGPTSAAAPVHLGYGQVPGQSFGHYYPLRPTGAAPASDPVLVPRPTNSTDLATADLTKLIDDAGTRYITPRIGALRFGPALTPRNRTALDAVLARYRLVQSLREKPRPLTPDERADFELTATEPQWRGLVRVIAGIGDNLATLAAGGTVAVAATTSSSSVGKPTTTSTSTSVAAHPTGKPVEKATTVPRSVQFAPASRLGISALSDATTVVASSSSSSARRGPLVLGSIPSYEFVGSGVVISRIGTKGKGSERQAEADWAKDLTAARATPKVAGTVVVHAHSDGAHFSVGEQRLTPVEFAQWLVDNGVLGGATRVVLAACYAAQVASVVARALADHGVVEVVAADQAVYSAPRFGGLFTFTPGVDPGGRMALAQRGGWRRYWARPRAPWAASSGLRARDPLTASVKAGPPEGAVDADLDGMNSWAPPGSSGTTGTSVDRSTMTPAWVAADGDCLIAAVLASAQAQRVPLPAALALGADPIGAVRAYAAGQVRTLSHTWSLGHHWRELADLIVDTLGLARARLAAAGSPHVAEAQALLTLAGHYRSADGGFNNVGPVGSPAVTRDQFTTRLHEFADNHLNAGERLMVDWAILPDSPPTPAELAARGLQDASLWNTSLGDDSVYWLGPALGLNIRVLDTGNAHPVETRTANGDPELWLRRTNGDHFDGLRPPSAPDTAVATFFGAQERRRDDLLGQVRAAGFAAVTSSVGSSDASLTVTVEHYPVDADPDWEQAVRDALDRLVAAAVVLPGPIAVTVVPTGVAVATELLHLRGSDGSLRWHLFLGRDAFERVEAEPWSTRQVRGGRGVTGQRGVRHRIAERAHQALLARRLWFDGPPAQSAYRQAAGAATVVRELARASQAAHHPPTFHRFQQNVIPAEPGPASGVAVSEYATTAVPAFVAEVFTAAVFGEQLSAAVRADYAYWNGPPLPGSTNHRLTPPPGMNELAVGRAMPPAWQALLRLHEAATVIEVGTLARALGTRLAADLDAAADADARRTVMIDTLTRIAHDVSAIIGIVAPRIDRPARPTGYLTGFDAASWTVRMGDLETMSAEDAVRTLLHDLVYAEQYFRAIEGQLHPAADDDAPTRLNAVTLAVAVARGPHPPVPDPDRADLWRDLFRPDPRHTAARKALVRAGGQYRPRVPRRRRGVRRFAARVLEWAYQGHRQRADRQAYFRALDDYARIPAETSAHAIDRVLAPYVSDLSIAHRDPAVLLGFDGAATNWMDAYTNLPLATLSRIMADAEANVLATWLLTSQVDERGDMVPNTTMLVSPHGRPTGSVSEPVVVVWDNTIHVDTDDLPWLTALRDGNLAALRQALAEATDFAHDREWLTAGASTRREGIGVELDVDRLETEGDVGRFVVLYSNRPGDGRSRAQAQEALDRIRSAATAIHDATPIELVDQNVSRPVQPRAPPIAGVVPPPAVDDGAVVAFWAGIGGHVPTALGNATPATGRPTPAERTTGDFRLPKGYHANAELARDNILANSMITFSPTAMTELSRAVNPTGPAPARPPIPLDDPGWIELNTTLHRRPRDLMVGGSRFTVIREGVPTELWVRARLVGMATPVPAGPGAGVRKIDTGFAGSAKRENRTVRVARRALRGSAAFAGAGWFVFPTFGVKRNERSSTMISGGNVLSIRVSRSSATANTFLGSVEFEYAFITNPAVAPVFTGVPVVDDGAKLEIPEYLARTAPKAIAAAPPQRFEFHGRKPRMYGVEDISDTTGLFDALVAGMPDGEKVGSTTRTTLLTMANRREVGNQLELMLDTAQYSPLLTNKNGSEATAVRVTAELGEAALANVADKSEAMMRLATMSGVKAESHAARHDGVDVGVHGGFGWGIEDDTVAARVGFGVYVGRVWGRIMGGGGGGSASSRQLVDVLGDSALYKVAVTYHVQRLGEAIPRPVRGYVFMRVPVEEAQRLADPAFTYPTAPLAKERTKQPTNADEIQPPDYLSYDNPRTIGSAAVADLTNTRQLHAALSERLTANLKELFYDWATTDPSRLSLAQLQGGLQNHTTLAGAVSHTSLRSGMNNLLDVGLRIRLRDFDFAQSHYYTLVLKAVMSHRKHVGTTKVPLPADISLYATGSPVQFGHRRNVVASLSARATAGFKKTPLLTSGEAQVVSYDSHRGYSIGYNNLKTGYTLSYDIHGQEVFDYDLTFSARLLHHSRPRHWLRTVPFDLVGRLFFHPTSKRVVLRPTVDLGDQGALPTSRLSLWVPASRSWKTGAGSPAPLPRIAQNLPADAYSQPPVEQAHEVMNQRGHAIFNRPNHVDAFDHAAGLVSELARQALNDVAPDDPTLTTEGAPAMQQLADWFSLHSHKPQVNTLAARNGLSTGGLASDGTYANTTASVQIRMTVNTFEVVDVIENMITEDYHQGAVVLSVSEQSGHDVSFGQVTARVGAPMVGQEGPGRAPGSTEPSGNPVPVGRLEVVVAPLQYGKESIVSLHASGGHERMRSHVGRYLVIELDATFTALAQLRATTGPVSHTLREAARAVRTSGLTIFVTESDARDLGLLPEDRLLPPVSRPEEQVVWAEPDFYDSGLGTSISDDMKDLTELVAVLRDALPSTKLRRYLPADLADDVLAGTRQLLSTLDPDGVHAFLDDAFDGGVPIPLFRMGMGADAAKSAVAYLKLTKVGPASYHDISADTDIENYMIATHRKEQASSQSRTTKWATNVMTGGAGQLADGKIQNVVPAVANDITVGKGRSNTTGEALRIDSMITATGPTPRFLLTVRPSLEIHLPGGVTRTVDEGTIRITVRAPEVSSRRLAWSGADHGVKNQSAGLVRPPAPAPTVTPVPGPITPDEIRSWKNQPGSVRLPLHTGPVHLRGLPDLRDAGAQAIGRAAARGALQGLLSNHGDQSSIHAAFLKATLSQSFVRANFALIHDAADPGPNGELPPVDGAKAGLTLPMVPLTYAFGWKKEKLGPFSIWRPALVEETSVDLRVLANVSDLRVVGAAAKDGDNVRQEQRRILTRLGNERVGSIQHGGLAGSGRMTGTVVDELNPTAPNAGPPAQPMDYTPDVLAMGVPTVNISGTSQFDQGQTGRTGDAVQTYRDVAPSFRVTATVTYRVMATVKGHTEVVDVTVPEGIVFWIRENELAGLRKTDPHGNPGDPVLGQDFFDTMRPHVELAGRAAGEFKTASRASQVRQGKAAQALRELDTAARQLDEAGRAIVRPASLAVHQALDEADRLATALGALTTARTAHEQARAAAMLAQAELRELIAKRADHYLAGRFALAGLLDAAVRDRTNEYEAAWNTWRDRYNEVTAALAAARRLADDLETAAGQLDRSGLPTSDPTIGAWSTAAHLLAELARGAVEARQEFDDMRTTETALLQALAAARDALNLALHGYYTRAAAAAAAAAGGTGGPVVTTP